MTPTAASAAFMAANPEDPIPGDLTQDEAMPVEATAEALPVDTSQLMDAEEWGDTLAFVHSSANDWIKQATGEDCGLQETFEGFKGRMATVASHSLIMRRPRFAQAILDKRSSPVMEGLIVASYLLSVGMSIRAAFMAKAARDSAAAAQGPAFASVRTA